ncbi:MAG: 50S ribosomal protein L10 [Armatimonadetes bacterium]|nr:50S ribosomal protein L10 [Armatimonadota bacterium]MBX3110019.1 50S ribosomal protein L10 [Fimbriimonadaceae bacterium]
MAGSCPLNLQGHEPVFSVLKKAEKGQSTMQTAMKPQIQAKANVVDDTQEKYSRAAGVFFTGYSGLKVKEIQALRKELKAKGGELHVIKNTLFRKAVGDDASKISEEMTSGATAYAFVYENESDCAKVLFDFAKSSKKLTVKGGILAGKEFNSDAVENLSKLPPREVLIAQVIGAVAAPLSNLVGVIEALYADPIRVIGAVADKVAEGSPIEAKAPEAPAADVAPAEATSESTETAPEATAEEAPTAEETPAAEEPAPETE